MQHASNLQRDQVCTIKQQTVPRTPTLQVLITHHLTVDEKLGCIDKHKQIVPHMIDPTLSSAGG